MSKTSTNARTKEKARRGDSAELLACTVCGRPLRDTAEENVAHGEESRSFDEGMGLCRECGGDPKAETPEGRLGEAALLLVRARIRIVAERLSPKYRARFLAMPLEGQARVVFDLLRRGAIR